MSGNQQADNESSSWSTTDYIEAIAFALILAIVVAFVGYLIYKHRRRSRANTLRKVRLMKEKRDMQRLQLLQQNRQPPIVSPPVPLVPPVSLPIPQEPTINYK